MNFIWTRGASADASRDRHRTDGRCVGCPTCSCEIPVVGTLRLPQEFSVLCPNCRHRNVYQSAEVRDPKQDAAATMAPRNIQFGKKVAMQFRSPAG